MSPAATGCRGLPAYVLKQLLQDIEDQGGFHEAFKLKTVCAANPEMYGLQGTAKRRAIQNKTQRLKQLSCVAYLELLVSFGIAAFPHQRPRTMTHMPSLQSGSGIRPSLVHKLLRDIESHGGLHGVWSLRTICNRKPDVYGQPCSTERRMIQNKVNYLKRLSREAYLQMLLAMGIQMANP